jgi:hypothetical protein
MPDFFTSFDREQGGKHIANNEGFRGIGVGTVHNNMLFVLTLFMFFYFNMMRVFFVFWGPNEQIGKFLHTLQNSTDLEKTPFLA